MTLYNNKYRIEPARLTGYDYGSNGAYHITICTKDRLHYFGDFVETDINQSSMQDALPSSMQDDSLHQESVPLLGGVPPKTDRNPIKKTDRNPSLRSTLIGTIASEHWLRIPHFFPFVSVDSFIIMPNHIHGILFIEKTTDQEWKQNKFGSQSQNIPSIIRGFKSSVKRYANANNIPFEWQDKYHDRIIRDKQELDNTRLYIFNNPTNWMNDEYRN